MNVSRETKDRLLGLQELVKKWNSAINLVSSSSLSELWLRHIEDSIQVYRSVDSDAAGLWVDLGSGGGFPALVCAILDLEESRFSFTLIESDRRKCVFLRQVSRELDLGLDIRNDRIELVLDKRARIVSARGLARLNALLNLAVQFNDVEGTTYIFPKGKNWRSEVLEARRSWSFDIEQVAGAPVSGPRILKIPARSCKRRNIQYE